MMTPRYWLALYPDVSRPIGGAKQVHRLAEALSACGREATLIQQNADFHPGWFSSEVSTVSLSDWRQRKDLSPKRDVLILPETFLPDLLRDAPDLPRILFNQNASYSFGLGPGSSFPAPAEVLRLYRSPPVRHVLCVSQHDEALLSKGFGLGRDRVSRLINAIETDLFRAGGKKRKQVAYMPRKNKGDVAAVTALLQAQAWWNDSGWSLRPIENCSQQQVAEILRESLVFLSFGHPEGFGLPLAEALASGCALAGYSGLGGRELFRLAFDHNVGVEVAYGDWLGFVEAVAALDRSLKKQAGPLIEALQGCASAVRERYSPDAMRSSVATALARWEAQL